MRQLHVHHRVYRVIQTGRTELRVLIEVDERNHFVYGRGGCKRFLSELRAVKVRLFNMASLWQLCFLRAENSTTHPGYDPHLKLAYRAKFQEAPHFASLSDWGSLSFNDTNFNL